MVEHSTRKVVVVGANPGPANLTIIYFLSDKTLTLYLISGSSILAENENMMSKIWTNGYNYPVE